MTNDSQNKPSLAKSKAKTDAPLNSTQETSEVLGDTGEGKKQIRWVQIRLIPIWLRIVIVLILIVLAVIIGTMIGYGVIGEGEATDVFKRDTWRHMFDIMNGKE